jgi:DNA (cytosine-5)-methyltransferase 1
MNFGSVCSGIEAASVAWHPLGWKAAWLSEIEPFPSAVLKHHYPDVPNLGDMTTLPDRIRSGDVEAPDVFCGGTPCQAFSVAGLRKSLDDARGNLSLVFCEISNAIDTVRAGLEQPPAIIFWENVPGVLSTADNAFGCFLAGLAGEDDPLVAPRGKWTNAGVVLGPTRAVAWRTLDAQYFGVAQRRRRVFVVASARDDFDPAAVLFEFDGVRRDSAPSRQAGQGTAHATAPCLTSSGRGVERTGDTRGQDPVVAVISAVCPTLRAGGNPTGGDRPPGTDVDTADSLIAYTTKLHNTASNQAGKVYEEYATSLDANSPPPAVFQPIAFHPTQDPISNTDGTTHGLGCGSSGGQASVAVAVALRGREGGATAELGDEIQNCLRASQGGGDKPHVLAPVHAIQAGALLVNPASGPDGVGVQADHAYTLEARSEVQVVQSAMQVRRLTPIECERLQGFPDNYTAIPWRKKPASECPDGPRYKALGNSWAVPVVRWIGRRIQAEIMRSTNPTTITFSTPTL